MHMKNNICITLGKCFTLDDVQIVLAKADTPNLTFYALSYILHYMDFHCHNDYDIIYLDI